jgi:hypothetical protein
MDIDIEKLKKYYKRSKNNSQKSSPLKSYIPKIVIIPDNINNRKERFKNEIPCEKIFNKKYNIKLHIPETPRMKKSNKQITANIRNINYPLNESMQTLKLSSDFKVEQNFPSILKKLNFKNNNRSFTNNSINENNVYINNSNMIYNKKIEIKNNKEDMSKQNKSEKDNNNNNKNNNNELNIIDWFISLFKSSK